MRIIEKILRGLLGLLSVVVAAYAIYILVLALPQTVLLQPNPFQPTATSFINASSGALLTGIGWLLAAIFLQLLLISTKTADTRGLGEQIVSLRSMVAGLGRMMRDRL